LQTLVRRGKEREQGKKSKKPSLMKRAVQHSRSEARLNSSRELEQHCRARVEEAQCRLAEMLRCNEAGEVTATVPAPTGDGVPSSVGAETPPRKDSGFAWVLRRQYSVAVSQAEEQVERSEAVLKEVTREATLEVIREVINDLIREVICEVELDEQGTPASREGGAQAAENVSAESCEGGADEEGGQEEGQGFGSGPMDLPSEGEGGKASDKEAWEALEPTRARIREALERSVYHCGLCSVDCSSREHFENHCNGAKHLKASRKLAHVEVVRLKRSENETGCLADGRETPSRCYQGQNSDSTYATHEVSPELNAAAKEMLSKLHNFQERLRITDPMKYKARRRLLYGLREAMKAVKLGKVKSLIVAPNIEQTSAESKGRGPDDALAHILAAAEEREVPVVFALTRAKMGKIVGSRSRISIVAVLDCSGAEQLHKQVLEMAREMEKIDVDKKKTKIEQLN
jgi:ribosomal protein L7Ae-like RNA K-turn-binding protein